jgi:pimeloyl-ACP methyl ester carboxylesterase
MLSRLAAATLAIICATAAVPPRQNAAQVVLQPCPGSRVSEECGALSVFEDRAAGRGRKIDIHFVVARANASPARQAVFLFAGGPGEGSADMAGGAAGWLSSLRATLDLVFVDQRGTGQSHPLSCPSLAETDPAAIFGHVFNPAVVARCRETLGRDADLTKYTTDLAVADVDDVRTALGYERISLYGVSYGTRMAQEYLKRFPSRVRSVVLDGVVPFDVAIPVTYAASAQQSLERVFAACAATPSCRSAYPHPAADFERVLHRFDRGSVQVRVNSNGAGGPTVSMSRGDFGYAVRGLLYNNVTSRLAGMLARAADSGDLGEFATAYWLRARSIDRAVADGLHLSVFCAEDVPFATDREIAAATTGTFLGRYLFDEYRAACRGWPRAPLAADARTPVVSPRPTLLLSGAFDPVTPPAFGDRVARSLSMSLKIVSPLDAHGAAFGCAMPAVLYVLGRGTIVGAPAVCQ